MLHKVKIIFFIDYLFWHYNQAWRDLARLSLNSIFAINNLFDFGDLIKNLFSPFKRVFIAKEKGQDNTIQNFFENLIANMLSRLVGFLMRLFLIAFGLAGLLLTIIFFTLLFILWVAVPFLVIYMIIYGIINIFNGLNLLI